jgi:hypothetical protein
VAHACRKPGLEGTNEHNATLVALCDWVRARVEAEAARRAQRVLEHILQEQQAQQASLAREHNRQHVRQEEGTPRQPAAQIKAMSPVTPMKTKEGKRGVQEEEEQETEGLEEEEGEEEEEAGCERSRAWERKLRKLAVKLNITRARAVKLATCQSCDYGLDFCTYKGCLRLLEGSCGCDECALHRSLAKRE